MTDDAYNRILEENRKKKELQKTLNVSKITMELQKARRANDSAEMSRLAKELQKLKSQK